MKFFDKIGSAINTSELKERLKNMSPRAIFYDMCHFFATQKIKNGERATSVFSALIEGRAYLSPFSLAKYEQENTEQQIFLHGTMYKTLYEIYTEHLKKETCLIKQKLSYDEYKKLPKKYRGIFYKADNQTYVLKISTKEMIIAYNKKNKEKLNELLNRARNLIPFVWGSIDKKTKDAQLESRIEAIKSLHDIFVEIAKKSVPVKIKSDKQSSAQALYAEYVSDFRQNRFLEGQNVLKSERAKALEAIKKWYQANRSPLLSNQNTRTK